MSSRLDPDTRAIRTIAFRLAGMTVALLLALLLLTSVAVYLTTRAELSQSLRNTLQAQASDDVGQVIEALGHASSGLPGRRFDQDETGGIFIAFANRSLSSIGGSAGPFSARLPDIVAARQTVQSGRARFTSRDDPRDQRYLLYTEPVRLRGAIIGIVQAGIPQRQYDQALGTLLRVLLVVGAFGAAAAAGITGLLVARFLRPIRLSMRRQRDFVADAAHELRTPLTIIHTAAELALGEGEEAEQQEALELTLQETNHLARLVDDLALLARADAGGVRLTVERLDLGRLVTDVAAGVGVLAEDRDIELRLEVQDDVWAAGDTGRLRQLLLILLDNALKHTPAGGTIAVRVARQRGHARLDVQDTGPGIAPYDLPHLFDRFYRSDHARSGQGTGLGLAIAQSIVEAHGGHITATNADQGGAVFTVTLPTA